MWGLDRFSTHSTPAPSPPGRNSPAPRRSLQVSRPGLAPRTSSLSLLSSSSQSNLPSTARTSVSSGLKNQIYSVPPEDVEDSLTVFERIISSALRSIEVPTEDGNSENYSAERPEKLIDQIDFHGQSLEEFLSQHGESATSAIDSSEYQYYPHSVEQFEREKQRLDDLHTSIQECDTVLSSVENYLTSFQSDLSKVSEEIESLQSRSTSLNSKLEARRHVEKKLGPHVEQVALAPGTVTKIADGSVDEAWIQALNDHQAREKALNTNQQELQKIKAVDDLRPLIDELSKRAIQRIRDHFASKIKAMRSPNINSQVLQQNDFLRYKPLFSFLSQRQPQLAEEILQAYANTMRWYYATHFTRYRDALGKLRIYTTDKSDVLGEDVTSRPGGAAKSTSSSPLPTPDLFNLARRIEVVRHPTISALPSSTAEEAKTAVHLEIPFLHYNLALLDNATSEYTFLANFLPSPPSGPFNAAKISRALTAIFNPAFEIGSNLTRTLINDSYDALALLLCIRLTQHLAFTLQRRRIPTLDTYVNGTSMLLWPRFQMVLDAHLESLKRATSSLPARQGNSASGAASAAFASLAGGSSSSQASAASTAPHPITQRFANLLRGILALSAEARDDEPVGNSVARLREGFEAWITKMAQSFGAGEKGRRERERFMQSNYGLVLAVLAGDDVKGKLADDCRSHFQGTQGVVGS